MAINTNFPAGLNILSNTNNRASNCTSIKTLASGFLVSSFTEYVGGKYTANLKALSPSGAIIPSIIIPDIRPGDHFDIDLAEISGTDDFIAVWSSGTTSTRRIIGQRYNISQSGLSTVGGQIDISGTSVVSVAPRICYNITTKKLLVIWVSVTNKTIWLKLLNEDLSDASQQVATTGELMSQYFNLSLNMHDNNVHTGYAVDIALTTGYDTPALPGINSRERFFITLKGSRTLVRLFYLNSYKSSTKDSKLELNEVILPFDFEDKEVEHFDMEYDAVKDKLMIVYGKYNDDDIYGLEILLFSQPKSVSLLTENTLELRNIPKKLNIEAYDSYRPRIKRTNSENINTGSYEYIVAWETQRFGIYFNRFSHEFIPQGAELEIQHDDSDTDKAQIVISDNQFVIVMEAHKFHGSPVQNTRAILFNTTNF
ncbi:hypothetical protein [Moellerella wisconsensis]|uniref:hypothetical protein n=1 Tax=Moellerella wisconsensis TaxID=158849 RepID=UPI0030767765